MLRYRKKIKNSQHDYTSRKIAAAFRCIQYQHALSNVETSPARSQRGRRPVPSKYATVWSISLCLADAVHRAVKVTRKEANIP